MALSGILAKLIELARFDIVWVYVRFYILVAVFVSLCIMAITLLIGYENVEGQHSVSSHPILMATLAMPFAAALR